MASFMRAKLFAEFLGTFLLVFTVGCNVLGGGALFAGISIGSVLMVCIYCLGGISGANFNPAVSVSLGLIKLMGAEGGLDCKHVILYILAQLLGGIAAGVCYSSVFHDAFTLEPQGSFSTTQAAICEILYTFVLCFVVMNVACAKTRNKTPNEYYGLAIGFVIIAGAYGAGPVSGACFNPAVAFGIDASSKFMKSAYGWSVLYAGFEVIGAVFAVLAFMIVRPEEFEKDFEHDEHDDERRTSSILFSEFLGTLVLVATVGLNVFAKSPAAAFSIAASLMCMIYALGDVSGGHFNPAVTWAVLYSRLDAHLTASRVALHYIMAQTAGGVAGAFLYVTVYSGKTLSLGPKEPHTWLQAAVAETVFTFILCFVVLTVTVTKTTQTPHFFGLAIGSCITVGGVAVGGISGAALNPALAIGVAATHVLEGGLFWKAILYTFFELLGGCAALGMIKLTHVVDIYDDDWEKRAELSAGGNP